MNTTEFLKKEQDGIEQIILGLKSKFSSHDFIEKFAQKYEADYIDMLVEYKKSGQAFQSVHSIIAKFISKNMKKFGISKSRKDVSENVFGSLNYIQWWKKI